MAVGEDSLSIGELLDRLAKLESRIDSTMPQKFEMLEGRIGLLERFMVFFDTQKLDCLLEMVRSVDAVKSKLNVALDKLMDVDIRALEPPPAELGPVQPEPTFGVGAGTALVIAHSAISSAALAALDALGAPDARPGRSDSDLCGRLRPAEPRCMDDSSDSMEPDWPAEECRSSSSLCSAELDDEVETWGLWGLSDEDARQTLHALQSGELETKLCEEALTAAAIESSGEAEQALVEPPLHEAISLGDIDVARQLLLGGPDVDSRDSQGDTALHLAAYSNNNDLVCLLLYARADPNVPDAKGKNPLRRGYNSRDVVETLLVAGAEPNARDRRGSTALHRAAEEGCVDVMEVLFSAGTDVNAADENSITPLHRAAESGHVEAIKLLLSSHAALHLQDLDGNTALHLAAYGQRTEACNVLVTAGADPAAKNNAGETPSTLMCNS